MLLAGCSGLQHRVRSPRSHSLGQVCADSVRSLHRLRAECGFLIKLLQYPLLLTACASVGTSAGAPVSARGRPAHLVARGGGDGAHHAGGSGGGRLHGKERESVARAGLPSFSSSRCQSHTPPPATHLATVIFKSLDGLRAPRSSARSGLAIWLRAELCADSAQTPRCNPGRG